VIDIDVEHAEAVEILIRHVCQVAGALFSSALVALRTGRSVA
jgi:hypothetical protein